MGQALVSASCHVPSCEPEVVNIPGPQGEQGEPGEDGCTGTNAYTNTTADFIVPAVGNNVTVSVGQSAFMGIGQYIWTETAGQYTVVSRPTSTSVELENTGQDGNAAPTTNIVAGVRVSPSGKEGPEGIVPGDALLASNNLSDLDSVATARTNLGGTTLGINYFTITNPGAITFPRQNADNTLTSRSAADLRTDLSLVPGTNIQAFDAFLLSIAGLAVVADRMIYSTGVDTAALTTLTAYARTLLDDSTAIAARDTLGKVLPRYGVLAMLTGVDLNVATSDNAMTLEATRYRIDKVMVENPSVNVAAVTAGVFTAAGGAGTTLAADQALAALTATTKFDDLALEAVTGTDTRTDGTLYFRVGTPLGSAATANVLLLGWRLD